MKTIDKFSDRFGNKLIWMFILTYVFVFSYVSFLKYYSFGYHDWDFASDIIVLWNSVHGRIFYYPFLEQIIFGGHLYLIILLLMPVYAIFQYPMTLLFLQSLFLGLAAYPLYLLAKLKLNKSFALVIALAYLLYPPLGYINLFETHFEIYTIFALFFALYYFEKEHFNKFLIFIFLAIIAKENVSLVVFMFGIYAFLRKRSRRWILVPSLLGLIWFFLAIKLVIPYFARDAKLYQGGFIFSTYYRHLGGNLLEMAKTIVLRPLAVARFAFMPDKVSYLFQLFLPTGFIGFFSPAVLLLTLPIFMQNLLSSVSTHARIQYQYVVLLIPFIFSSVIHSFRRLLNCKTIYKHRIVLALGFLVIAIISGAYLGAPQLHLAKYITAYRINDFVKEKNKLIKEIPKGASVISTFQFLPKLANRYNLYSLHFVSTGFKMYTKAKYELPQNLEYALIDFNEPLMISSFFPPQAPGNIRSFLENGKWSVLKAVNDIILFKKDYSQGHKLWEEVQDPRIENVINLTIDDRIVLLGYDLVRKQEQGDNVLHFIYYWKLIKRFDKQLGFFIQFFDSRDNVKFQNEHSFGYRVYGYENWPKDQIIKEHYYAFIPSGVEGGSYNIRGGLFALEDGKILPVLDKEKTDGFGRIILGDIFID